MKFVLQPVMNLHKDANYLHRMTPLFAISKLGPVFTADIIRSTFVPVLSSLHQDKVANIRMNVAKTIKELMPILKDADIIG